MSDRSIQSMQIMHTDLLGNSNMLAHLQTSTSM